MSPRRLLTRPRPRSCIVDVAGSRITLAPLETRRRPHDAVASIPISSRAFRHLFDPADARFIERIDENVSYAGIGSRTAPVHSTDGAGEKHCRIWLRAFFTIQIWRKWSNVVQAATAVCQLAAKLRVLFVCVCCSDDVIRFIAVPRQARWLQRKRLCQGTAFARHVADRYWSFFDSEYGSARQAIENVHVCMLRHSDRRRNLFTFDIDIKERDGRGQIVIPEIVMRDLEIPLHLSGFRL